MRTYITLIILLITLSTTLFGQERADSIRSARSAHYQRDASQKQKDYYRRQLQGDTLKAAQVQQVQQDYKAKMQAVSKDVRLSDEQKRSRYQSLMEEKNAKLEKMLTVEQQARVIPSSERGNKEKKTKKSN